MVKKHQKELKTNEKFYKIMERNDYDLLQKSFSFMARAKPGQKPFFLHVPVLKGFDVLFGHPVRKDMLVEIKSNMVDVPRGIEHTRQIIAKYPYLPKKYDILVVGWKGGRSRLDRRTKERVWLERGYFQVYRYENNFEYDEKDRLYWEEV